MIARAACRGQDSAGELFFPKVPGDLVNSVGAFCMRCTVIDACLLQALNEEPKDGTDQGRYGISGGLTPIQRARIERRNGEITPESWQEIASIRQENAAGITIWPPRSGRRKNTDDAEREDAVPRMQVQPLDQPPAGTKKHNNAFIMQLNAEINARSDTLMTKRATTAG